ncbi:Gfo/Idh/MocA family protein [Planctomycetota bacterium]
MKTFRKREEIKVGVVGYGGAYNMGKHHLLQMEEAGMKPTAVAEIDPERLEIAREDFPGIQIYSSLTEMLEMSEDVNLVTIITPHNTHAPLAVEALNGGCHVVSEKPMTITTEECDSMINVAEKNDLLVTAYHNRHWDGCIMNALEKISAGGIGDVIRVEAHMGSWGTPTQTWRASKSKSGGILYDWGVHLLEYTFQLIDSDIIEVSGYAKSGFWSDETPWKDDTNEDEALAVVRYKNGSWSSLCISHIDSKPKEGQLEITGTKGTFVFSNREWTMITHEGDTTVTTRGPSPESKGKLFYENVAAYLTGKEDLVITPEYARRPIHVLDLADKSAREGKAVEAVYQ